MKWFTHMSLMQGTCFALASVFAFSFGLSFIIEILI